ncbi:hypothetical protein EVAR_71153_1 [Eumeta japonica]|uniref:Uncharacterized protein n=1 Tax=Eumeta variegata TaxID=151549 RepID=A0A4C1T4C4_EUMVA|nr:hypothetical protein EVAR_71153_1 [Eumeta japonica]
MTKGLNIDLKTRVTRRRIPDRGGFGSAAPRPGQVKAVYLRSRLRSGGLNKASHTCRGVIRMLICIRRPPPLPSCPAVPDPRKWLPRRNNLFANSQHSSDKTKTFRLHIECQHFPALNSSTKRPPQRHDCTCTCTSGCIYESLVRGSCAPRAVSWATPTSSRRVKRSLCTFRGVAWTTWPIKTRLAAGRDDKLTLAPAKIPTTWESCSSAQPYGGKVASARRDEIAFHLSARAGGAGATGTAPCNRGPRGRGQGA